MAEARGAGGRALRAAGKKRRRTALLVVLATSAALLVFAPDVLFVIFSGLLFGVYLAGGGESLARHADMGRRWAIGAFMLANVLALAALLFAFAPAAVEQVDRLAQELPAAVDRLRARLAAFTWGEYLLRRATPDLLMSDAAAGTAASAVATTFGAFGNLVVIVFVGLYVALDPDTYRRGFMRLLAPSMRAEGEAVLRKATDALRHWLVAQLLAMGLVGTLTWFGLWLIGIPLAPILGLIAALLAFIPNIGPIIAATPAILLGFSEGPATAWLVVGVYAGVQTFETYVITPLIQQERVSLPPALVISTQLLMGVLFGVFGLVLATPLAALTLTVVSETYVRRYLEREGLGPEGPPFRV